MKKTVLLAGLVMLLYSCTSDPMPRIVKRQMVTCQQILDYNDRYAWISGPLCQSDTCIMYQSVWKDLLLEKNGLSQDYFNRHLIPCFSGVGKWDQGVSFNICYMVKINWAVVYRCDHFIIKISKDNRMFLNLKLPQDVLLSKDEIRIAVNKNAFGSGITFLSGDEALQFGSNSEALAKLVSEADVNTLCFQDIRLNESGHMMLEAYGQYVNKDNSCVEGQIDLINGKSNFYDNPCVVF